MKTDQEQKLLILQEDFKKHIESLSEVYEKSDLKEKHRLNEHIKHLIKTYGELDTETLQKDI